MKAKEIYMYTLGGVIALCFFTLVGILLFKEMPSPNKEILYILLGILGAKFADVVGYFFGSSKGSADKTELLTNTPEQKQ